MKRACFILFTCIAYVTAHATTLYWDPDCDASNNNVTTFEGLGGAGTWHTDNAWWDGSSATNQNWADGSHAVFANASNEYTRLYDNLKRLKQIEGGTLVTLEANVTAKNLSFESETYRIEKNGKDFTTTGIYGKEAFLVQELIYATGTWYINIESGINTWGGTIIGRSNVTKQGAGTFAMTGPLITTYTYRLVRIEDGTLRLIGNAGSYNNGASGGYTEVCAGATFDVGDTMWNSRRISINEGGKLCSQGSGLINDASSHDGCRLEGYLTGSLGVRISYGSRIDGVSDYYFKADRSMWISCPTNDYTGGTINYVNNKMGLNECFVMADQALGFGPVSFHTQDVTSTGQYYFVTSAPIIGSLFTTETSKGTEDVFLGANETNCTLTVGALNTDDTYAGRIADAEGAVGSITKVGLGVWTLSGTNTYTGTTTINAGKVNLTGVLGSGRMDIANGASYEGTGTTTFRLDGDSNEGIVVTGTLDISKMRATFVGTPAFDRYILVDYEDAESFTGCDMNKEMFASYFNIPDGYLVRHEIDAQQIILFNPPAGTIFTIR